MAPPPHLFQRREPVPELDHLGDGVLPVHAKLDGGNGRVGQPPRGAKLHAHLPGAHEGRAQHHRCCARTSALLPSRVMTCGGTSSALAPTQQLRMGRSQALLARVVVRHCACAGAGPRGQGRPGARRAACGVRAHLFEHVLRVLQVVVVRRHAVLQHVDVLQQKQYTREVRTARDMRSASFRVGLARPRRAAANTQNPLKSNTLAADGWADGHVVQLSLRHACPWPGGGGGCRALTRLQSLSFSLILRCACTAAAYICGAPTVVVGSPGRVSVTAALRAAERVCVERSGEAHPRVNHAGRRRLVRVAERGLAALLQRLQELHLGLGLRARSPGHVPLSERARMPRMRRRAHAASWQRGHSCVCALQAWHAPSSAR